MLFQISMAVLTALAGVAVLTVSKNMFASVVGMGLLALGAVQIFKLADLPPSTEPLIAMSSGTMFTIMAVATVVGVICSVIYYVVSSKRDKAEALEASNR